MKYLPIFLLASLAACGDNNATPTTPDAPPTPTTPDAPVTPDAPTCTADATYPTGITRVAATLQQPFDLTLDGQGTRCEQLVRAILNPDATQRPPELAQMDVDGWTGTCFDDPDINAEVIRLQGPLYAGKPLYGYNSTQDVLIHIGHPTLALLSPPPTISYLDAHYFVAGATAQDACLDGSQLASSVPGRSMTYGEFSGCQYVRDGSYAVASDDVIEVGDEGYFVDSNDKLHRVRAVDVYLLPGHLDAEVTNSDSYCCNGTTLEHCVGQKLLIDVVTGEIVGQMQHCTIC